MALQTPTTKQHADNIVAAIEGQTGRTWKLLPKSFTRVLAKALAGIIALVYRYAGWSLLQMFAQHASFRETTVNGRKLTPLIEIGRWIGVGSPQYATNARHQVGFAILDDTGSPVLPAGSQLVHPPTGVIYITESDLTLVIGGGLISVIAVSDPYGTGGAGTQGNRDVGDVLKWANPLPQLDINGATVLFTLTTAADAETEDEYRQRVIDRRAFPPQGGAYADYRIWAKTVEGILHAYPYTGRTPGTVDVYIEADTDTALDDDGTPTIAQRDAVAAAIEQDSSGTANRRPVSSYVTVEPISRQPFDVRVTGLIASSPDAKDATKVVILEALDDFLRAREPFIEGISPLPRADRITQSAVAGVVDEAASTQGATVSSVAVLLAGSPIVEYTLDFGQKAKRGNVTWL